MLLKIGFGSIGGPPWQAARAMCEASNLAARLYLRHVSADFGVTIFGVF